MARARPLILGHRGASALAPENTLIAFSLARDIGADGFECDVHLSKDGVPVVIHDQDLKRSTDGQGAVQDLTVGELKKLDAGSWFGPKFKGQRIPTLEEALALCSPSFVARVELKEGGSDEAGLARKCARLVTRIGHAGICTFSEVMLRAAREESPNITAQLICEPWTPGRWKRALATVKALKLDELGVNYHYLTAARVNQARDLGLGIDAWTVNRKGSMKRLAAYGVRAIETDRPDLALMALL